MWDQVDWNSSEFTCRGTMTLRQRHRVEQQKLLAAFPYVAISATNGLIRTVGGAVETFSGTIRDYKLSVPDSFPYEGPRAYPVGWTLHGPHQYPEERMCLWPVNGWEKHYTVAYAVAKTIVWIHKHELFIYEGRWLGNEAH